MHLISCVMSNRIPAALPAELYNAANAARITPSKHTINASKTIFKVQSFPKSTADLGLHRVLRIQQIERVPEVYSFGYT